ncbi:MAG: hypothetical protein HY662_04460 [Chloroflexi bacterium]|nr:hypothetical protein [Chloroflexota bacterium]
MAAAVKLDTRKLLADAPEEYAFRTNNGHILRNLKDLANELKTMSDETYAFHVNDEKNDFTNWVRDIIKDDTLAEDLRGIRDRARASRAVSRRVTSLSRK